MYTPLLKDGHIMDKLNIRQYNPTSLCIWRGLKLNQMLFTLSFLNPESRLQAKIINNKLIVDNEQKRLVFLDYIK